MKRKLNTIWQILTCKNYLLVANADDGNRYIDYTMDESDVKLNSAFLFNYIDAGDKTLEAFKILLDQ